MKNVLVLNCGSSSIKYRLFDNKLNPILNGLIEKIGEKEPQLTHKIGNKTLKKKVPAKNLKEGIKLMVSLLQDKAWGGIKDVSEIRVVGHRVVHGGAISRSCLATPKMMKQLDRYTLLAPLHNPHNITGIKETAKVMPCIPQVMVFDTAFHQTMPKKAYMYGLPYKFYTKYSVRRYGFHGMSHQFVTLRTAELLKKRNPNLITCHLGAGSSLAAVNHGKSVDTSMGLTPLEGVMMGTRTGDFDPAILQYIVKRFNLKYDELYDMANHSSGLLGISGISKDVRFINAKARKGNVRCKLALEMFCYRVAKYIGAYAIALKKVDAIVFTAGIGENAYFIRNEICSYLEPLGVKLDKKKNKVTVNRKEGIISAKNSKIKVLVVPTNEELMIAREALSVIRNSR